MILGTHAPMTLGTNVPMILCPVTCVLYLPDVDCKIPMVCAVIDGTHIEIIAPRHNENQDNYFSPAKYRISLNKRPPSNKHPTP